MGKVYALVLAAGFSRRMGKNKLLLPLSGHTVLENTVANLINSALDGVAVVLGNQKELIREALAPYQVQFVDNVCFTRGMSASIRAGITSLSGDGAMDAVLILPGDMPFIRPVTVNRIIQAYRTRGHPIVVPVFQGQKGHPVLFDRALFSCLTDISGDVGAREVVSSHPERVFFLEVDDPGISIDIDSPEEYNFWQRNQGK